MSQPPRYSQPDLGASTSSDAWPTEEPPRSSLGSSSQSFTFRMAPQPASEFNARPLTFTNYSPMDYSRQATHRRRNEAAEDPASQGPVSSEDQLQTSDSSGSESAGRRRKRKRVVNPNEYAEEEPQIVGSGSIEDTAAGLTRKCVNCYQYFTHR